jgi:hypothetical protein
MGGGPRAVSPLFPKYRRQQTPELNAVKAGRNPLPRPRLLDDGVLPWRQLCVDSTLTDQRTTSVPNILLAITDLAGFDRAAQGNLEAHAEPGVRGVRPG